jgi:hypothetical protein
VAFAIGQTTKTVNVTVNGDRIGEPNEIFLVNLSQASDSAVIADGQAAGTILDDEPRLVINDVSKKEGQSGTTQFLFTVIASPAPTAPVSVTFATAEGSAKSVEDYDAGSGSLSFAAGQTSKTISVSVRGDRKREGQEVFYLKLLGASGGFVTDSQGDGIIRNDD